MFTEPEHFAHWFGTPPFMTPPSTITMDVRPGGEFRATMVHETDGTELPSVGHFREVVESERLVQTLEDVNDPNPNIEVFTVTLTLPLPVMCASESARISGDSVFCGNT